MKICYISPSRLI